MFVEDAANIEATGNSTLASKMEEWVGHMCTYLDSRNYWNAQSASSVGDQHTPNNCKTEKTSLDFQGVQSGSEGTFLNTICRARSVAAATSARVTARC